MSELISLYYALVDISEVFVLSVSKESKVKDILNKISMKQKKTYSTLYYELSEIDPDDIISDYWLLDPNYIFIASDSSIPSSEFINHLSTISKPEKREEFHFYFTGSNGEMLLEGISIELQLSLNPDQCNAQLLNYIKNIIDMTGKRLIIYLAGGLLFLSGTLNDFYSNNELNPKKIIYGVVTRDISDEILDEVCFEPCDVSDLKHQLLISPLCESSVSGLCDVACLLGYLSRDGFNSERFRDSSVGLIRFAPYIISLNKVIKQDEILNIDVVNVCSTLFTFIRSLLPAKVGNFNVFEYCLRICNLMLKVHDIPDHFPILQIPSDSPIYSVFKLVSKICSSNYLWLADINQSFEKIFMKQPSEEEIESAYELYSSFTPILPLSIVNMTSCSIVKGKDHNYLFIMKTPLKNNVSDMIDVLDPMKKLINSVELENFAKQQQPGNIEDIESLIEPSNVKQIIMINFDKSGSMKNQINGKRAKSDDISRFFIAYQCILAFMSKIYSYHIPSILGLLSFGSDVEIKHRLSIFEGNIEQKFNLIRPSGSTKLWDSLKVSCNEICKFRKNLSGNEIYENAISRIVVISDGDDNGSLASVEDVVKMLIKNKIVVDSIILGVEQDLCNTLCSVCHITGGYAIKSDQISKLTSFFEYSSIVDCEKREKSFKPLISNDKSTIPTSIKIEQITQEFMNKINKYSKFDTEFDIRIKNVPLATSNYILGLCSKTELPNLRYRRILRELHEALKYMTPSFDTYDSDIKVFPYKSNFDQWIVFIKGDEDSYYKDKWWKLHLAFPDLYPNEPPIVRFVTVPYHVNVSIDGKICMDIIDRSYMRSVKVIRILQHIKEIFINVDLNSAVRIDCLIEYLFDKEEYEKLARESGKNAKTDLNDYLDASSAVDDASFKISKEDDEIPQFELSQLTGKQISNDNLIMATSGVYYDKNELKRYLLSYKKPICIITGKYLTEQKDDF